MSPRRAAALLAALALVSPLAVLASSACGPAEHCPMAGLMGEGAPCHGTAIQADDCCVTSAGGEPADLLPVVALSAPAAAAGSAPRWEPAPSGATADRVEAPTAPLFRLYRALLI